MLIHRVENLQFQTVTDHRSVVSLRTPRAESKLHVQVPKGGISLERIFGFKKCATIFNKKLRLCFMYRLQ